ncbi:hypothetical protein G3T36_08645 [Diaminobutyricibacter tongyongensis]|uniref:Uncharacterized protein n=1 Tax=Leifsonia tongyongensis TaxID=1268043 RepID=A0A6L9XWX5_9MICO|nr:hypothetical protein [Diaminobutyricibacter tongyongensis]NEN05941.1 hypothetical protein [Diaminobutyricibacter tongyongensis]
MLNETYEIVIRGTLSPAVLGAFPGFDVTEVEDGFTHLVGTVPDQARLHGLLDTVASLNIELVSVNPRSPDATRTDQHQSTRREET